jgi:hypothetical protein
MSTLTNLSVTCRTGEEYGRKQWKLIIQEILRFSTKFSAGVPYMVGAVFMYALIIYRVKRNSRRSPP